MADFEQSGYQTTEPVAQEPKTQEPITQEPVTTQDDFIEVKYNHEPLRISRDEAPTYIQKGLNYDKLNQRLTDYEQRLNDLASVTGYQTPDELFNAIEDYKRQQEMEQFQQAGVDPDTFNQLLDRHPDIQYAREMKQQQEEQARFNAEASELFQEFPDLKPEQIPPEVWQIKEQRGLSLLDAYLRVSYKNIGRQKEQEAIQKLQSNAITSTGALGGGDVNHNTSIKDMPKSDFEALLRKVKNGEVRSL